MKRSLVFFVIVMAWSSAIALSLYAAGGLSHSLAQIFLLFYMSGPAVAALICARLFNRGHIVSSLGLRPGKELSRFWLGLFRAWGIGVLLVTLGLVICLIIGGVGYQPVSIGYSAAIEAATGEDVSDIIAGPSWDVKIILATLFINGILISPLMLSEELGWRGWLWHELQGRGFWTVSLIIGLMWGIWHAPIIVMGYNYPNFPILGVPLFTLICVLFSPIFSYVRETGGSVWSACVLHGIFNASAGVAMMMQVNTDWPWNGMLGITGIIVFLMANGCIFFLRLRRANALLTNSA